VDTHDQVRKEINDRINERMQRRMERWEERMNRRHPRHGMGGLLVGGLIVLIGLMILLDNMGIIRMHDIWRFWPVLLIVYGVARVLDARAPGGYVWGGVVTLAGALLLLDTLDILVFDFNLIWPMLLIAFGLSMVLRALDRKHYLEGAAISDETSCNAFAVFGGSKRRIETPDFRGGEAVAVFGGVEFDLRKAGMTVEKAVIDVNVVCGGLEVRVPENWKVINRAVTIFGGIEDKTVQSQPDPNVKSPQLVITGSVVFGGISLRN
jgi:predicted membrane protein